MDIFYINRGEIKIPCPHYQVVRGLANPETCEGGWGQRL